MGSVWNECAKNVVDTVKLLDSLGFVVHPEKPVFIPTQKLVFLGFVLDSVSMLVYLTPDKALKLKQAANALFNCQNPTIREVAEVLGLIVSSFPGVAYGPLHYRYLERDKTTALKTNKWNFDAKMSISNQGREDSTTSKEQRHSVLTQQPTGTPPVRAGHKGGEETQEERSQTQRV